MGKKVSVAALIGAFATAKHIYDAWKSAPDDLKVPDLTLRMTGIITPGYETRLGYQAGDMFDYKQPVTTWGPAVGGVLVHKYIGGKDKNGNGLNLNAQLRAVPFFQI